MAVRLIYDIPNLLFRVAAAQRAKNPKMSPDELVGISMHTALFSVNKYFKAYKPDQVVFSFENTNNWRKAYTARPDVDVPLQYKANRIPDPEMAHFFELIGEFKEVVSKHTSVITLSLEGCECDDCIAGFCQMHANDQDQIYVVSGDKDFIQLLKYPNVQLINPDNGKPRNQPGDKIYFEDIDYFMFLKCVRGDMGDYVHSAFPRVRETRVLKAYQDPYERVNFMNETWEMKDVFELNEDGTQKLDENGKPIPKTYRVGDLFEENKKLMDLECQPEDVRERLIAHIEHETQNFGQYSNFQMIKFLGRYRLNSITDNIETFIPLWTANSKAAKGGAERQQVVEQSGTKAAEAQAVKKGLLEF